MTTSNSARGALGPKEAGLTTKRRQAGTSLVEILVVIVIFLIGILAVVQIFPRGFRLLLTSRNGSMATAIGRDEIERIKSNPGLLPNEILPVVYIGGVPVVDPTVNPISLGPAGDGVSASGGLTRGGSPVVVSPDVRDWEYFSGSNSARRIIGEGQRVPAPRRTDISGTGGLLSSDADAYKTYGGLMVLDHGPVDDKAPIVAYANDLTRSVGEPRDTTYPATVSVTTYSADGTTSFNSLTGRVGVSPVAVAPFEYFVLDAGRVNASILFPATYHFDRSYRIRMSAYIGNGTGYSRVDYPSLSIRIPKVPRPGLFVRVYLADVLANTPNSLVPGTTFGSAELDSIRVAPQYDRVEGSNWTSYATLPSSDLDYRANDYTPINPFEVKLIDGKLGTLLFSPAARQGVVSRPGGVNEPLIAKVDYDVLDWRVIREDFRITGSASTVQLALQSIKVGGQTGPDGRANGGIWPDGVKDPSPSPTDNVAVMDLTTGYLLKEFASDGSALIRVDKSRGTVTFLNNKVTLLAPGLGREVEVPATNRTFRVMYRARNEWAVQLIKGASQYTQLNTFNISSDFVGQFFVGDGSGGTRTTRIYFPRSEVGHKVTIDNIAYMSGGTLQTMEGQDFIIKAPTSLDVTNLPYADLVDVDRNASAFAPNYGQPVRGVKGASVAVRVLWNPEAFALVADPAENIRRIEQWGRSWRSSMTQTYLRAEETR